MEIKVIKLNKEQEDITEQHEEKEGEVSGEKSKKKDPDQIKAKQQKIGYNK